MDERAAKMTSLEHENRRLSFDLRENSHLSRNLNESMNGWTTKTTKADVITYEFVDCRRPSLEMGAMPDESCEAFEGKAEHIE